MPELNIYITSAIGVLFAGNLFFLRRLVTRIDESSISASKMDGYVTLLNQNIISLTASIQEIRSDLKDLRKMEVDVAVLRYQLNQNVERMGQNPDRG